MLADTWASLWAQVVAQRRARVLGAEAAPLLQERDDLVGEVVEPARGDVRDEDEAVARVGLHELVHRRGDRGRGTDERLAGRRLDDDVAQRQVLRLGERAPLVRDRDGVAVHPHAGPALGDRVLADDRVFGGKRAVGVAVGQVAVPQLLGELDRGLAADLLAADDVRLLLRVVVGVAEHERRRGEDLEVVGAAAVARRAGA